MKRINPATNLPFVRGEIREDGYFFYKYAHILRKDGTFKEIWLSPEAFNRRKNAARVRRMETYERTTARLLKGWSSQLRDKKRVKHLRQVWERMFDEPMTLEDLEDACWSEAVFEILKPYAKDYGN